MDSDDMAEDIGPVVMDSEVLGSEVMAALVVAVVVTAADAVGPEEPQATSATARAPPAAAAEIFLSSMG